MEELRETSVTVTRHEDKVARTLAKLRATSRMMADALSGRRKRLCIRRRDHPTWIRYFLDNRHFLDVGEEIRLPMLVVGPNHWRIGEIGLLLAGFQYRVVQRRVQPSTTLRRFMRACIKYRTAVRGLDASKARYMEAAEEFRRLHSRAVFTVADLGELNFLVQLKTEGWWVGLGIRLAQPPSPDSNRNNTRIQLVLFED